MIKGFSHDEKKALIAILKYIINADGRISEQEISKLDQIADKKGFEDFTDVFREVDEEIKSYDDLKDLISRVTSSTHRLEIFKYAAEVAVSDAHIEPEEIQILKTMSREWNIDIKTYLKGK